MVAFTIQQVYNALIDSGFDAKNARKMTAIALRESKGTLDPQSRNYNPPIEDSWGIYQINMLAHGGETNVQCATDLQCSTKFARNLWLASGYQPWAGTQDEAGLQPYYAKVDATLKTIDAGSLGSSIAQSGNSGNDIAQGVKDFFIVVALELVALILIGAGAWGLVSGKGSIGATVTGAAGAAKGLAKSAAKLAAL